MKKQPLVSRGLTVAQWRQITLEGAWIPVRIQLNGYSMQPLVRRLRDYVTVQPLRRPLKVGDIVLFADDMGRYVVHRVWKLQPDWVITLGDNCKAPDRPLRYDQIWGLVTRLERGILTINLDNGVSRLLGRAWMGMLPVRLLYHNIRAQAGRIYRKMKGR